MISTHLPAVVLRRLLAVFTCILSTILIHGQIPDSTFWVPNGPVDALVLHDTTVIIGGDFDQVSPVTGSFVRLDTATAQVDPSLFKVNGTVYAMCRDSVGNVYVGGSFSRAGNQSVENIFRITPAGQFDNSFVCAVDGPVYSLYFYNTDLYIGGDFGMINGEIRNNCGSVNLDSGGVNIFDPNVNGPVYCMSPDTIYGYMVIGGDFTGVSVFSPPYLAKVNFLTGQPLTFNAVPWTATPNTNGPVYDVEVVGNRVIFAGEFTTFGPYYRRGLAKIILSNGNLTTENANVNGSVYAMNIIGSRVFIGGIFNSVGLQARQNLGCVDVNFVLDAWAPGTNGEVRVITQFDTSRLFVGGDFSVVRGDTCIRGALINYLDSGTVSNWNPKINRIVYAAELDTLNQLYAGGAFFGAGGTTRNNLCALSVNNGRVTSWNPNVGAAVRAMTLDGDTLYFTGDFGAVNSTTRGRTAAIDLNTFSLLPFNPGVNGLVRTIAVTDSAVYMGGNFTSLGGQARMNIGKVDKYTSLATPWNPGCPGTVNSILPTNSWVYVAGYYSSIAGVTRENLSRLHPTSGIADWNWICNTDDGIYHAEFYNGKMVLGGWFNTVNGISAPDFAFLDTAALQVTAPAFNCDGFVRMFTNYGDDFFVSGTFDLVNTQYQPRLVAYDEGNNNVDSWTPAPNYAPVAMQATASRIYVGGAMSTAVVFHPFLQVMNIQWVTSLDEQEDPLPAFEVYPVPATDEITIAAKEATEYFITDIAGKIVQAGMLDLRDGRETISISGLAPGLYIITLTGENASPVSRQIIKQ